MAKKALAANKWTRNTIVDVLLEPTTTASGKIAKHGLVKYTQPGSNSVYEWEVREDSDKNLIASLEVGKTYAVYLKAITYGYQTGYDWNQIEPVIRPKAVGGKITANDWINAVCPDLFLPSGTEPEPVQEAQPNAREDVLALLKIIAEQDLDPAVEALVMLVGKAMLDDEDLFK